MTDPLLDDLTETQRRAVTAEGQPVCIVAGAGAGKTRVLTRRIAYRVRSGQASPDHVMVVTFTRKAAVELVHRLSQLGLRDRVAAGTFHSLAAGQLRTWWADRGQRAPSLLDRKGRLIGELLAGRPGLSGLSPAEAARHIEWAKARLIEPGTFAQAAAEARRTLPVPARELARLFARYEDEKRRRGLVDFDDLLAMCRAAFETDAAFAAAQRWRWRHLFVDEFQDLNPLQDRLLSAWLGPNTDLCAVGDPNQAIYGWNGSDPRLFEHVPARWPSTELIRLDQNHRCTPQVVTAASAVLGLPGRLLRSSRPDGPPVEVRGYPTDADEASGVAQALRRAHAGGLAWSQLAILVRTNAQIPAFAEALDARQVPHRALGATSLLTQPAVMAALNDLRRNPRPLFQVVVGDLQQLASNWASSPASNDPDALTDSGGRAGMGDTAGSSSAPRSARASSLAGAAASAGPGLPTDDEQGAALTTLADLADDYSRLDPSACLAGFEAWLAATLRNDSTSDDRQHESVTICTFHRAKGLEWPAVWVCGLEEGLVPHSAATGPAREEERRLLYVALTRAERELHCSYAKRRRFGTNLVPREPSSWLDLLDGRKTPAREKADPAQARASWLAHLQASRERLERATTDPAVRQATEPQGMEQRVVRGPKHARRPVVRGRPPLLPADWPTPDPAIVDALRSWRTDQARRSGIPAGVLLHDVTLQALASLRPSTEQELADMPGLGPVQAKRYGPTLLPLVADPRASA